MPINPKKMQDQKEHHSRAINERKKIEKKRVVLVYEVE